MCQVSGDTTYQLRDDDNEDDGADSFAIQLSPVCRMSYFTINDGQLIKRHRFLFNHTFQTIKHLDLVYFIDLFSELGNYITTKFYWVQVSEFPSIVFRHDNVIGNKC